MSDTVVRRFGAWGGLLLMGMVAAACATEGPMMKPGPEPAFTQADRQANVIELEQAVYFPTAEGAPVAVPPGFYQVTAADAQTLRLTPVGEGAALTTAAAPSSQTPLLEQTEPVAVALPGEQEDTHHILFAQIDGTGLEAAGSYSGTQTRALGLRLSPWQAQRYLDTKTLSSSLPSTSKNIIDAGQAPAVSAPITITPGPTVLNYQECTGLSGYVSSVVAMVIAWQGQQHPPLAARGDTTPPRIVLTGNPAQSPPQPIPRPSVTYPNTPFKRVFQGNPHRCMFGSVTVSTRNLMAGSKVRLKMRVHDMTGFTRMIADTYELPMTASGTVTFGKVVVGSVSVQNVNTDRTDHTTFVLDAFRTRAPNGALVKIEASIAGAGSVQRDCLYKPVKGAPGAGTLTCK